MLTNNIDDDDDNNNKNQLKYYQQLIILIMKKSKKSTATFAPVRFPGVHNLWVANTVVCRLIVEEVKHVLDGKGQEGILLVVGGRGRVAREYRLEKVVHESLKGSLLKIKRIQFEISN